MNWRERWADRLAVKDKLNNSRSPGWGVYRSYKRADNAMVSMLSEGDRVVFFTGAKMITSTSISMREAKNLMWALFWHWWVKATWCGWKLRIWRWLLRIEAPLEIDVRETVDWSSDPQYRAVRGRLRQR